MAASAQLVASAQLEASVQLVSSAQLVASAQLDWVLCFSCSSRQALIAEDLTGVMLVPGRQLSQF